MIPKYLLDGWQPALVAALPLLAVVIYFCRAWLLPKPIPGIPYRPTATKNVLGDIPELLKATSSTGKTYMQWIQEQMLEMNTPIVQMFIRPFLGPVLILADYRETHDILMRVQEWDRSEMLGEVLDGLLPDHHLHLPTNATWRAHRKLLQNLMAPSFLNNIAAPGIHNSVSLLIELWGMKASIADGRPFSAEDDIYTTTLDSVHAFAFGKEFRYNATRPKLAALRGLDPPATQRISAAGVGIVERENGDDHYVEPIHFPEAKLPESIRATLDLTEAVEKVQGSPLMRLTWKLMMLTPRLRRARKINDAYIRAEVEQAVYHMEENQDGDEKRSRSVGGRVRSAVDHMVAQERDMAGKEKRDPQYFSQAMLTEVRDPEVDHAKPVFKACEMQEVADQFQTFGFVVGGHDTTSTTILWGLKKLADNQSAQSKLRAHLRDAFPDACQQQRNPSASEITGTNVPYLDATIEEILRHSGTTPALDRQATRDTHVLGHAVPKGTIVLMLTQGPSLQSPAFEIKEEERSIGSQNTKRDGRGAGEWDPESMADFLPERWLRPVRQEGADCTVGNLEMQFSANSGPILSFGLGLRGCFGRRLGYLSMRILVTLIVWNFELLQCPPKLSGYSAKMGVTTKPKDAYVRLRKVTSWV
ncbi:Isotrichodermin C-15 hydroxylase [Sphaceloma murrayae]|uniref:Isotrichodermin C-15 hydroxylase n=1 Tax=Sphaceloma murrayae TaxID=2082308 RepID=A0A2K1QVU2_9PEZI|nr:Isotrichodermin C-15 hydroxylase [Sphaceloma murrayae]